MITPKLLYGIEIKSDADTYARLSKQVRNYDWYYDLIYRGNWAPVMPHISKNMCQNGGESLQSSRMRPVRWTSIYCGRRMIIPKPRISAKSVSYGGPELNLLLQKNNLPKYRQKSKQFVQETLIEKVPADILWPQAYEELFERDYNTIGQEIEEYRKNNGK